ncbi:MAG: uracil-DNA glycosylase [Paracoccaceae bacterium]
MTPPPAWAHLRFFREVLPGIEAALASDPRLSLPPAPQRFRALDLVAPVAVRVVLLGQDPYPEPGKANGLAFSVSAGFDWRRGDSLSNIFKELQDDLHVMRGTTELDGWARQGVLLLNTALSVPEGDKAGHARIGWRHLVEQVLAEVAKRPTAFLLWGRPARAFRPRIAGDGHLVVESPHPSPLSAHRGFFGSRPFSRVNAWLAARGEPPVDWAA